MLNIVSSSLGMKVIFFFLDLFDNLIWKELKTYIEHSTPWYRQFHLIIIPILTVCLSALKLLGKCVPCVDQKEPDQVFPHVSTRNTRGDCTMMRLYLSLQSKICINQNLFLYLSSLHIYLLSLSLHP